MTAWYEKLNIVRPEIKPGQRIIAISDIHGNLPYFKNLLKKINYTSDDVLIIDGDFLEKGGACLDTLRYIMDLHKAGNVYVICGNCDCWAEAADHITDTHAPRLIAYMTNKRSGIFYEMLTQCGVSITEKTDFMKYLPLVKSNYKDEWEFLRNLPGAVEYPNYIFVHGGMKPFVPLEDHTYGECMKLDNFMSNDWVFNKWVIVGHWPVMLYLQDRVCANPIINRESKVISIDGACVLKDDGQLNALIIPFAGSEEFNYEYYDPFPTAIVKNEQKESKKSYYIRWGDNEVEILESGSEFSICRHLNTGYVMDILNKYLFTDKNGTVKTNDCSDYILPLSPGDEVSIIEKTSRGYYVKHKGTCGWYYGELING